MPGWIIQGVRGEGKSLCAVSKIREYMLQGRPVATNLDLFLDKLLPDDCKTLSYRLPDHPRLEDFEVLPSAYDVKYKGEDKNGLLVLDEMGTWFNSRSWSDKERLRLLNWLFLSRKEHWDIILLAQDVDIIDAQARTTLCDFLVQASRSDRQKIPYFGKILRFLGFSGYMPLVHKYFVYNGLSMESPVQDVWYVDREKIMYGYDTNQRFRHGLEAMNGTLVDMRATYTYLPANYLSGSVHVERITSQIDNIRKNYKKENLIMPAKASLQKNDYLKPAILTVFLVAFLVWRYFFSSSAISVPSSNPLPAASVPSNPVPSAPSSPSKVLPASLPPSQVTSSSKNFLVDLIATRDMRVVSLVTSPDVGILGRIDFYDKGDLVESLTFKQLQDMGAIVSKKSYGVSLLIEGQVYMARINGVPRSIPAPHQNNSVEQGIVSAVDKIL